MLSRHNELSWLLGSYLHHSLLHSLIQLRTNENNEHANKWISRRNASEPTYGTCISIGNINRWKQNKWVKVKKKMENLFVSTPTMTTSTKKKRWRRKKKTNPSHNSSDSHLSQIFFIFAIDNAVLCWASNAKCEKINIRGDHGCVFYRENYCHAWAPSST